MAQFILSFKYIFFEGLGLQGGLVVGGGRWGCRHFTLDAPNNRAHTLLQSDASSIMYPLLTAEKQSKMLLSKYLNNFASSPPRSTSPSFMHVQTDCLFVCGCCYCLLSWWWCRLKCSPRIMDFPPDHLKSYLLDTRQQLVISENKYTPSYTTTP